jgi:hypothetical protein
MWITERKHADKRAMPSGADADTFESFVERQRELARARTCNTAALEEERMGVVAEMQACEGKRYLLRRLTELRTKLEQVEAALAKRASGQEAQEIEARLQLYEQAYAEVEGKGSASGGSHKGSEPDQAPAARKRTATGAVKKPAAAAQQHAPGPNSVGSTTAPVLRQSRALCDGAEKKQYHRDAIRHELQAEFEEAAPPVYVVHGDMCDHCNVPMIVLASEALLGCPQCSRTRLYIQATSSRIAYGEEVEFANFSYKRQNHFQEWLNTFQAKESTEVPKDIIDAVMDDLYTKKKVRDTSKITQKKVKEVLKDLKLRKYYDHAPQITARITGILPPRMSPFQAEQTKLMFAAIQGPFNMHCPPERTNFLSYGYCLYKFCELLGYDEFLPCFPLLKGRDKLAAMDRIWKKICAELNWQFIPSTDAKQSELDGFMADRLRRVLVDATEPIN